MQRRAQSRRAGADHQHVGVVVVPVVAVHIGVIDRGPQTGRLADEMLVQHPRMARRAHKGFVIKTGHEKRRQHRGDGHGIEFDGRPGVLRAGAQAVFQLYNGGCDIGLVRAVGAHGQEGVGFLDPRGHDAARTVVFERTCDQMLAMGEQGRCHRVTGKALEGLAVQCESQRRVALNATALGQAVCACVGGCGLRHGSSLSLAMTTDSMSCVTVWRFTTSQRRQPSVCCQNSVWMPLGFLRV